MLLLVLLVLLVMLVLVVLLLLALLRPMMAFFPSIQVNVKGRDFAFGGFVGIAGIAIAVAVPVAVPVSCVVGDSCRLVNLLV